MANLTPNEKELLAVVKYYNDNQSKIDRLVYKLVEGFSIGQASLLTGYDKETVEAIHNEAALRKGKRNVTKAINNAKKAPARMGKAAKEIAKVESKPKKRLDATERMAEKLKNQNPADLFDDRMAIHVEANSGRPNKIAYDISKRLEKGELKSGEQFWSGRELSEKFEISRIVATEVFRILREHNWIDYADRNRVRLGYVVK